MIKLSDEELRKMARKEEKNNPNIDMSYCRGYIAGIEIARDYYDAQIDKQAKTMEGLWRAWASCNPTQEARKFAHEKDMTIAGEMSFGYSVAFFLAGGGTIKDGE